MDSKVALIIVDLQEDFCPPNGSLAVSGGRDISHLDFKSYETRLWPYTAYRIPRVPMVPELDIDKVDKVVEKGQDKRVEMYSAFADPFENPYNGVGKVYVVGLAMDYCVKATAQDAVKEGFNTYIIEDATKAVDPDDGWKNAKAEMEIALRRVIIGE
ncbi:Isochorismatase-like protein [Mycena leptocephala]|nr:Isochorismatase-like protein [Mycena leptocephala]